LDYVIWRESAALMTCSAVSRLLLSAYLHCTP